MIGIYKITNIKNGKVYIGQSVKIETRIKQHKRLLRDNNHQNYLLQDDWNIYGEKSFSFEVIQKCRSVYLNEIEKHTIKEYHSDERDRGYNLTSGNGRDLSVPSWYASRHRHSRTWSGITANEVVFFKNDVGETEYNAICTDCSRDCKQSFRADVLMCPRLEKR